MADVGLINKILSMNEKHGKRGKWIGLFYLKMSDISAATWSFDKKAGPFLTLPL
jgi:hypothetical protein